MQFGMRSVSQELWFKSDMSVSDHRGPNFPAIQRASCHSIVSSTALSYGQIHYRMSCRNCCFTGRSWPLMTFLTSPHNNQRLQEFLLTWDGIEGSAVIMICQERHCLRLWSLGLRNREVYVFLCGLLQDSFQSYSSSLLWFIKHTMFISLNQFASELLSI